jgi:hypothetical protein
MNDLYLKELARRATAITCPDVTISAFPKQLEFIKDPHKLKALFCTRRSAKSFTAGLYLVHEALKNPGCNCLFIGLTRSSAKDIIWKDILRIINQRYGLNASFNQTLLTMTFPNGSLIQVTGVDADQDEMHKLLGRKYRLACIDEASMYTIDMNKLVYGVLGPAMVDPNKGGERGTICMLGTASNFPRGLFFDVTTRREPGWKVFEWSAHDNPYVAQQWAETLNEIQSLRPLYMETPQFKQWYLNEWIVDESKLVYRFNSTRNLIKEIPANLLTNGCFHHDLWSFVLGIDTGWEDDNAWVLTGYHLHDPHLYVLKIFHQQKMTFDQVSDMTGKFLIDPKTHQHLPCRVIIDGSNKQGVESMRVRSSIPFEAADKQDKVTFIELMNADLVQGNIKILDTPNNRPLWEEMSSLVWMTDGDKIKIPKKEHPALSNHLCDAFLYSWRMGFHYHAAPAPQQIPIGSKAWYEQSTNDIWEREREGMIKEESFGEMPGFSDEFKW